MRLSTPHCIVEPTSKSLCIQNTYKSTTIIIDNLKRQNEIRKHMFLLKEQNLFNIIIPQYNNFIPYHVIGSCCENKSVTSGRRWGNRT